MASNDARGRGIKSKRRGEERRARGLRGVFDWLMNFSTAAICLSRLGAS